MSSQISTEVPPAKPVDDSVMALMQRVANLEAEVAELKILLRSHTSPPYRPTMPNPYAWLATPPRPPDNRPLDQLSDDELVPIHYLTDEDVRRRLDELEQWYGMSSTEFYARWQRGEVDEIQEKMGWSILYEHWLQIEAETAPHRETVA